MVPFFSPDNVFGLEKPEVSFNKKSSAQVATDPEQEHKPTETSHGSRKVNPKKIEPVCSYQKGPKGRYCITWNWRKDIFNKGAKAQHTIDQIIRERIKRGQKSV